MRQILCFGNPLHGDDGFGPAVYQGLAALPLPDNLRLIDAGATGLAALGLFQDCDEIIIVDALAPGGTPGRLRHLSAESIAAETSASGHGIGVGYLLRAVAAVSEQTPRIRIIAVETLAVTPFRPGLSEPVAAAVNQVIRLLSTYFERDSHG